jgi:diguanylate cyclase (GGDEF)-like protein
VIGRFAGDEFIALSTSPTPLSVDAHTSKLAKAVEDIRIDLDGVQTRITLSIGVAILDMSTAKTASNLEPLETIKQLIEQADEQMYISKRNGRDQIHSQLVDQQLVQQGAGAA